MKKEDILKFKPKIISEEKRLEFFEDGGIKVENVLSAEWLQKCQKAVNNFINESRKLKKSNSIYDIQPNHTKENPKLRRVSSPCDYNDDLWRLLTEGPIGDVAEDILGPVVRFYQSKLNFKNPKGGTKVNGIKTNLIFHIPTTQSSQSVFTLKIAQMHKDH